MGDFKKRGGFGGGRRGARGFDRKPGFQRGGAGFGRGQMFPAVCDKCGKDCEVPFRPTGERPVLCSNCFAESRGMAPREERRGGRDFAPMAQQAPAPRVEDKRIDEIKRQLDLLASKLDKLIAMNEAASLTSVVQKTVTAEASKPKVAVKAKAEKVTKKVAKKKK